VNGVAEPLENPPLVSVIVAAKYEEDNIEACVTSTLKQDYPNFEFIVVDDRSQDKTPEILARLGEADQRLSVIRVDRLPPGWSGKNHALHLGVQAARGEWFLFIDADAVISPSNLSSALSYAYRQRIDLLSLIPLLRNKTFWEKVLVPYISGVLLLRVPLAKVNDPEKKTSLALGLYMLIRRKVYESIGGHEAIKGVLLEDMTMARSIKEKGLNLRMALGRKVLSNRMYRGFKAVWRGWVRIFYLGFVQGAHSFITALFLIPLLMLFPAASPIIAVVHLVNSPSLWAWGLLALAVLVNIVLITSLAKFYRASSGEGTWAIFYPLAGAITLGIILEVCFRLLFKRPISWRGTTYSMGQG
jgi:chlorobactene glucosyltransferase